MYENVTKRSKKTNVSEYTTKSTLWNEEIVCSLGAWLSTYVCRPIPAYYVNKHYMKLPYICKRRANWLPNDKKYFNMSNMSNKSHETHLIQHMYLHYFAFSSLKYVQNFGQRKKGRQNWRLLKCENEVTIHAHFTLLHCTHDLQKQSRLLNQVAKTKCFRWSTFWKPKYFSAFCRECM
jgi:hypothetical protein